jgi:SAM-dependent methyltransferase
MTQTKEPCCAPGCCGDERTTIATTARPVAADSGDALRSTVREKYGAAALRATEGEAATCGCGTSCCSDEAQVWDPITADLYDAGQTEGIPQEALLASLGCGNPTALAQLSAGETVLDLGSGGGIDVLLSARRVGPTGKAYGLDMTDEMLALARENQRRSGMENVEFLKGEIEHIPLPDASVDVIISNCVINLSADKAQVLREAARVLRPGGRFAVSDVVLRGELPEPVRQSVGLWTGCVSGALHEDEYRDLLRSAGFIDIDVEPTRIYSREDTQALLESAGLPDDGLIDAVEGKVMSAFVRGVRGVRG